jgi:hypothetical protein
VIAAYNTTKLSNLMLAAFGWGFNRNNPYTAEFSLYAEGTRSEEAGYRAFEDAAARIVELAQARNIQVIPVLVPSRRQLFLLATGKRPLRYLLNTLDAHRPFVRMADILARHDLPSDATVNLLDAFSTVDWQAMYYDLDGHWNEHGHQFVTRMLRAKLPG